ncbi:hypothetical protein [Ancylobacter oerskovii]|uniref:Uncharacterized protein n=1 Tax=Ancylobacter oerskovii TaxID=459519 RepID=A0ABW4Z256_9HYPH|nr:hypothetical protein [Ancylobacter oerskovii]MBS7542536.1 hypothetical protein [Ancylobacter oerskovii]
MIDIDEWSPHLTPRNSFYELKGLVSSGGRVADGREQRVQDDVGFWRHSQTYAIRNRAQALAYRAMLTRLRAGEAILAKVFDAYGPPTTGTVAEPSASLTAAADLRATTVSISTFGLILQPGIAFSIGHRLHRITKVVFHTPGGTAAWNGSAPWDGSAPWIGQPAAGPDLWTVNIQPPLRQDLAAGTNVDFFNLQCLCVIEDVTSGDIDLDLGFFADPTLSLIETI